MRLCGCIRLCNELFRTVNCVKQPPSIYRRHGRKERSRGIRLSRACYKFIRWLCIYIHSRQSTAADAPIRCGRFTFLPRSPCDERVKLVSPFRARACMEIYARFPEIELTSGAFAPRKYHSQNAPSCNVGSLISCGDMSIHAPVELVFSPPSNVALFPSCQSRINIPTLYYVVSKFYPRGQQNVVYTGC